MSPWAAPVTPSSFDSSFPSSIWPDQHLCFFVDQRFVLSLHNLSSCFSFTNSNNTEFLYPSSVHPHHQQHQHHHHHGAYSETKQFRPPGRGRQRISPLIKPSATTSHKLTPTPPPPGPLSTVLIGPKQQRFKVNKRLLCASASFFSERLQDPTHSRPISLWLPRESASMFALFVEWVHLGPRFRHYIDDAVVNARETGDQHLRDFHWAMIRLHLFASHLALHRLQDLVMDAVQDLYLRRDWDVPPSLINYLYTECEDLAAIRLRRWAVAMVAFSFNGGPHIDFNSQDTTESEPARFSDLLDQLPEFSADYDLHMRKMRESGLDIRFKNPQLRIPANRLRNDERAFGFRQCSFHSHRATVGERRCPHEGGHSAKFHRIHSSTSAARGST